MFYVSPAGNDANSGTSTGSSWRTIDRVNQGSYKPGDAILFEGGRTFKGSLLFHPGNTQAGSGASITIGSFGSGRATISSDANSGLFAQNVGGLRINNLSFVGSAPNNGASGIAFVNETNQTLSNLYMADLDISRYTNAIYIATGNPPAKFQHVRLERVVTYDNAMGPGIYGYLTRPAALNDFDYGITDVYVGHIESYSNTGAGLQGGYGGGLVLMNVDKVRIEHNVIHDNGGNNPEKEPNGPSGIIVYDGRNVVIQENEIYHQRFDASTQTDAGGIDMWAIDAVLQYNYVHDNEGWAFVLGSANSSLVPSGAGWLSKNVTIRYNICENNARALPRRKPVEPYSGATVLMFGQLENYEIYNNTFYSKGVGTRVKPDRAQGMIYLVDVPGAGNMWSRIHVRNNALISIDNVPFIEIPRPEAGTDLRFENNAYVGTGMAQVVKWGSKSYSTVAKWSAGTGQEKINGAEVWKAADPGAFCAPGKGDTMFPRPIADLKAYRLHSGTPLIDVGSDLRRIFRLDPGKRDFFGNAIPTGAGFDIGAHEYQAGQLCN